MVTASGMLSLPIEYLQDTVAASSTFQTWTGTANAGAAEARVHVGRAAAAAVLPLASIGFASGWSRTLEANGLFLQDNSLDLMFRDDFSSSLSEEDAAYTFLNQVGPVMTDVEALAGTATYLDIVEWTIVEGPYRTDEDEEQTKGYIFDIILNVRYDGI